MYMSYDLIFDMNRYDTLAFVQHDVPNVFFCPGFEVEEHQTEDPARVARQKTPRFTMSCVT